MEKKYVPRRKGAIKRDRMLEFIREYIDKHGYPPSIAEIKDGLDISSTSIVSFHLLVLEKENRISRIAGLHRGIRVIDEQATS